MPLDLQSLKNSIDALGRSVAVVQHQAPALDPEVQETLRAGVIQQFEVAYELCWKFMQRWLRENTNAEEAAQPRTRKELFRLAARHGLVPDPAPWFEYGEARNLTSHIDDQSKAAGVFETALRFHDDAQALLARLEAAND